MKHPNGFVEGRDFSVRIISRGHPVLVAALHGGKIEHFTSEIAEAIAGSEYNLYDFRGIMASNNWDLHISSTEFDDPRLNNLLRNCRCVISIHGEKTLSEKFVIAGGLNLRLRDLVAHYLRRIGIKVICWAPNLLGTSLENIVNRSVDQGVQLELSRGLRNELELSFLKSVGQADLFGSFVNAIQAAVDQYIK